MAIFFNRLETNVPVREYILFILIFPMPIMSSSDGYSQNNCELNYNSSEPLLRHVSYIPLNSYCACT